MFSNFFKVAGKKKDKTVAAKGFVQLGADGLYFQNLDDAYLNSPTATMALLKFKEYCEPVDLKPEYSKLWKKIADDYIKYGYYLLNVLYNIDGEKIGYKYLNPKKFLAKDFDDNDNASTFLNIKTGAIIPTFNPDPTVVKSQFPSKKKGGFAKFQGQIYMYNDSSAPYRVTPFYSVLSDMKTEANASTFVDKACNNALFGNSIFVVKKSSDQSEKELEVMEDIKASISAAKGVDEAAQNLMLEYAGDIDDVTKLITKISIANDIDVDMLDKVDDKASAKICMACYGFPQILVKQSESVFGNSGESLRVAEDAWRNTCLKQADYILDGFREIGFSITAPALEKLQEGAEVATVEVDDRTAEAQATLKGSVGGVHALLAIQQGVSSGTTTFESAVNVLDVIFGFNRDIAIKLLGNPDKTIDNASTSPPDPATT